MGNFQCCFSFLKKEKIYKPEEVELLSDVDNRDYDYSQLLEHNLIPKYINYNFIFNINPISFLCNNIHMDTSTIIEKDIQLTYVSRQIRRNKNLLTILDNKTCKTFEFTCFKGDTIFFIFNLEESIELIIIEMKKDGKYVKIQECKYNTVKLKMSEDILYINVYWKYTQQENKFYQDMFSQSNKWFSEYKHSMNDSDIMIDNIIDSNYNAILLGFIKPIINPLIYNTK